MEFSGAVISLTILHGYESMADAILKRKIALRALLGRGFPFHSAAALVCDFPPHEEVKQHTGRQNQPAEKDRHPYRFHYYSFTDF